MKASDHIRGAMTQGADLFGRGAAHGELMNTTEPYDLPYIILADTAQGLDTYRGWLPSSFDVDAYRGSGFGHLSTQGHQDQEL
jgi:hypothetical protein